MLSTCASYASESRAPAGSAAARTAPATAVTSVPSPRGRLPASPPRLPEDDSAIGGSGRRRRRRPRVTRASPPRSARLSRAARRRAKANGVSRRSLGVARGGGDHHDTAGSATADGPRSPRRTTGCSRGSSAKMRDVGRDAGMACLLALALLCLLHAPCPVDGTRYVSSSLSVHLYVTQYPSLVAASRRDPRWNLPVYPVKR